MFWFLGYWSGSQESKPMNAFPSKSLSNNRKPVLSFAEGSAIQNRKLVGFITIVSTLACGVGALAQQAAKIAKIGYLTTGSASSTAGSFQREFRALGYAEGKNVVFEYGYADNNLERLPALAEELVRLKVDVLVTGATSGAVALKHTTTTIPVIFFIAGDPVEAGLVDSLPRPGGNITGFTRDESDQMRRGVRGECRVKRSEKGRRE